MTQIPIRVAGVPLTFDSPHVVKGKWQQRAYLDSTNGISGASRIAEAFEKRRVPLMGGSLVIVVHNTWMLNRWERPTDNVPVPPPYVGEIWLCDIILRFLDQRRTVGEARPVQFVSYPCPWTWEVERIVPGEITAPGAIPAFDKGFMEAANAYK